MRILRCPVCLSEVRRKKIGNGWNLLPNHIDPLGNRCRGSGKPANRATDPFEAWLEQRMRRGQLADKMSVVRAFGWAWWRTNKSAVLAMVKYLKETAE